jgi:hypothetical protein
VQICTFPAAGGTQHDFKGLSSPEIKMKMWIAAATAFALATGAPLAAQTANFGLGVLVGVPTGALNSTSYPDGSTETYNSTLGGQLTGTWRCGSM